MMSIAYCILEAKCPGPLWAWFCWVQLETMVAQLAEKHWGVAAAAAA
jgi:hypothetical protein